MNRELVDLQLRDKDIVEVIKTVQDLYYVVEVPNFSVEMFSIEMTSRRRALQNLDIISGEMDKKIEQAKLDAQYYLDSQKISNSLRIAVIGLFEEQLRATENVVYDAVLAFVKNHF